MSGSSPITPVYKLGEYVRYKGSTWQIDAVVPEAGTYLISGGDWDAIGMIRPIGVTGDLAISVSMKDGNENFVRV